MSEYKKLASVLQNKSVVDGRNAYNSLQASINLFLDSSLRNGSLVFKKDDNFIKTNEFNKISRQKLYEEFLEYYKNKQPAKEIMKLLNPKEFEIFCIMEIDKNITRKYFKFVTGTKFNKDKSLKNQITPEISDLNYLYYDAENTTPKLQELKTNNKKENTHMTTRHPLYSIYNRLYKTNNGLLTLNLCTGMGKSYSAKEFIRINVEMQIEIAKNSIKTNGKKIVFTTPIKANLPYVKLIEELKKDGFSDKEINKSVVFLNANALSIIENELIHELANKYDKDLPSIRNLSNNIKAYNSLKNNQNQKELKPILENTKNLIAMNESDFRKDIQRFLNSNKHYKSLKTKKDKADFINTNYPWLVSLYPAINLYKAKVVFMSVDKMIYPIDTLIETPFYMHESDIFKGCLVFMDEFDSCKSTMLNYCSEKSLWVMDLLFLIRKFIDVNNRFCSENLPVEFIQHNTDKKVNKISNDIDNLEVKYKLSNGYKRSNLLTINFEANDFFAGTKTLSSVNINGFNSELVLVPEDNIITVAEEVKKSSKKYYFFSEYKEDIMKIYFQFIELIKNISFNLYDNKKSVFKDYDDIGIRDVIESVLKEFGFENASINNNTKIIIEEVLNFMETNNISYENDFYMRGFELSSISENSHGAFSSEIAIKRMSLTPEKQLLKLTKHCTVIGLSATANIDSTLCNFDIGYLKNVLGNNYYELTKEENEIIDMLYKESTSKYRLNAKPQSYIIPDEFITINNNSQTILDNEIIQNLKKICPTAPLNEIKEMANELKKAFEGKSNYYINLIFQEMFVTKHVFNSPHIKSILNIMPNKMSNYESDVVNKPLYSKMIKWVAKYNSKVHLDNIEIYAISQDGLTAEEFEKYKERIFKYEPNKIKFYFGTYTFASVGQNFVCLFDPNQIKEFIKINDYGKYEKDIDGMFIFKPTNIYPNGHDQITIMTKLYYAESLYLRKEIDSNTYEKMIVAAINKGSNPSSIYSIDDYSKAILRFMKQGYGRVGRTSYKNPKMQLYILESLYDILLTDNSERPGVEIESLKEAVQISELSEFYKTKSTSSSKTWAKQMLPKIEDYKKGKDSKDVQEYIKMRKDRVICTKPTISQKELDDISITYSNIRKLYEPINTSNMRKIITALSNYLAQPHLKAIMTKHSLKFDLEKRDYVLNDEGLNLFKGYIGELNAEYLFGMTSAILKEMPQESFETFDYITTYKGINIYVDAKNFNSTSVSEYDWQIKNEKKLKNMPAGSCVIVINTGMSDGFLRPKKSGNIYFIPSILTINEIRIKWLQFILDEIYDRTVAGQTSYVLSPGKRIISSKKSSLKIDFTILANINGRVKIQHNKGKNKEVAIQDEKTIIDNLNKGLYVIA